MITIPELLWDQLLDEFARIVLPVERVAYLDGLRFGAYGVVTTVTIPDADLHPGYYDVSAAAMSQAGQHFREHGLARLAQVHTHGGPGCKHSLRDDSAAYSQVNGSVSIVLPDHADTRPLPTDGAVHIRRQNGWVLLGPLDANAAVCLVPSLLDYRSPQWTQSTIDTQVTSTGGWSRWIKRLLPPWSSRSRQN